MRLLLPILTLLLLVGPARANEIESYLTQRFDQWSQDVKQGRGSAVAFVLVGNAQGLQKHEQAKVLQEARAAAEQEGDLAGTGVIDFLLTAQLPEGSPASVESARSALKNLEQPPAQVRALLLYRWSFICRPQEIRPELERLKAEIQSPDPLSRLLLANAYMKLRRWDQAEEQLQSAEVPDELLGFHWEAKALLARGRGLAAEAIEARRQALEANRRSQDPKKILQARLNLANLFSELGHWQEAEEIFEALDGELGPQDENRGIFTKNWANFHSAYENYERSRRLNLAAVDFYRLAGKRWELTEALADLGRVQVELGALKQAETNLDEAQSLARELDYQLMWASTDQSFGKLYSYRREHQRAERFFAAARNRFERLQLPAGVGESLFSLVEQFVLEGRLDLAERECRSGIEVFEEYGEDSRQASAWLTLGRLFQFSHRHSQAQQAFERALTFYEKTGEKAGVGHVQSLTGKTGQALRLPLEREVRFEALLSQAEVAEFRGEEARRALEEAAALAHALELEYLFRGHQTTAVALNLYRSVALQGLTLNRIQENDLESALSALEQERHRRMLLPYHRLSRESQPLRKLMALRRRYALQSERAREPALSLRLEEQLLETDREFARLSAALPTGAEFKSTELQARLPENSVLLEYALLHGQLHLLVLDQSGLKHRALSLSAGEVGKWVTSVRAEVEALGDLNGEVAEKLVGRLGLKEIPPSTHLVIVPDGELHLLPFELLAPGRTVTYLNSAADLLPSREPVDAGEVRVVNSLKELAHGSGRIRLASRGYAKPSRVLKTNAFLEVNRAAPTMENPLENGGLIFAEEVVSARDLLDTDLSTCSWVELVDFQPESGAGLAVFGLKSSFSLAGAQRLLLPLWKVKDKDASGFLGHVNRLLEEGQTPAEALRRARELSRQEGAKASVWAAYVLVEL